MIAKLCKGGTKAKYSSEVEESENVYDADVDLQCAAGKVAISKRYQAFFDSWIMNKLKEWKFTLSSTSPTYRLQCCHLVRGENFVNIGQKERAALTQHFKDIKLELIEEVILEELTHGEHANEFKQIFKTQPLILSTFIENIVVTKYIEDFIKSTYGISGDEYNVKLFGASKSLWFHYWLEKVR